MKFNQIKEVDITSSKQIAWASICFWLLVIGLISADEASAQSHHDKIRNLGPQIRLTNISAGNVGWDTNGNPVLYTVIRGRPLQFNVIDVKTGDILKSFTIEGLYDSTNGAVAVAPDGTVYIGTRGNAHMYQYKPGADSLKNLGQPISNQSVLFRLVAAQNGMIYGSTYPGGNFFKYDPYSDEVIDYGQAAKGERYGRSIAYDPDTEKLFIGTGVGAKLIEYDLDTEEKTDITHVFSDKGDASKTYDLKVVAGHLFVRLNKGGGSYVIDLDNIGEGAAKKIPFENFPSEPVPGDSSKVLINSEHTLASFDLNTYQIKNLTKPLGRILPGKFVKLNDAEYPGYTYAAPIYGSSDMLRYNLQKNKPEVLQLDLKGAPTFINSIHHGPDGKIYLGGAKNGVGVYDPKTGTETHYSDFGQVEGMETLNSKIYFGNYTSARIYEYDPSLPWHLNESDDEQNPHKLFNIDEGQDRPFAMLGVESEDKLFIGTVPTYGKHNGVFSIYDAATKEHEIHKGIIENQSIISLAYKNGKVFGGGSIYGGLGKSPIAREAELFIWDIRTGKKTYQTVPVPGKGAITALEKGPEGNIWGLADGVLFIFNPATQKVIYTETLSDISKLRWRGGALRLGSDRNMYCTIAGALYMIEPTTKKITKLLEDGVVLLAEDGYGNLYFRSKNRIDLLQYNYDKQ